MEQKEETTTDNLIVDAILVETDYNRAKAKMAMAAVPYKTATEELEKMLVYATQLWEKKHGVVIAAYKEAEKECKELETRLRAKIVELYNSQTDKTKKSNLIPGWGVMVTTTYKFGDAAAVAWLIEHKHSKLLKPDTTGFKKLLSALEKLEQLPAFVTKEETPTAKISGKKED